MDTATEILQNSDDTDVRTPAVYSVKLQRIFVNEATQCDELCKRKKRVEDVCQRLRRDLVEENTRWTHYLMVDVKNKLVYCMIPKVGTTNWLRTLIAVSKSPADDPRNISFVEAHFKYKNYLRPIAAFSYEYRQHILKNFFKFMFVRNPYERILSAYRSIFAYEPSIYDKHAFRYRRTIAKLYRENFDSSSANISITFEEFLRYLTDDRTWIYDPLTISPGQHGSNNPHWATFFDLCNPCLVSYDVIGKHETMKSDAEIVLSNSHLHHLVRFPNLTETPYGRSRSFMNSSYTNVDVTILDKIRLIYGIDFDLFNYQKYLA